MKKIIELKQIRRTYQIGAEPIHALRDVSLDIHEGEYVAIMGHSGSGKSTLLNILGCLDTPDHGNYLLNEQETATLSEDEITMVRNKEIGFVFQNFNLLSRYSALENVCLPLIYSGIKRDKRIALAPEALLRVGLEKRMHHKPSELSGGQHQRVAIARALVNHVITSYSIHYTKLYDSALEVSWQYHFLAIFYSKKQYRTQYISIG